jgi:conjugal transfer pilus assembly protein TraB
MKKAPLTAAKKRQYKTAAAIFAIVTIGASVAGWAIKSGQAKRAAAQTPVTKIDKTDWSKPESIIEGRATWQSTTGAMVDENAKKTADLEKQVAELKKLQGQNGSTSGFPNIDLNKNLPPAPPPGLNAGGGALGAPIVRESRIKTITFNDTTNTGAPNANGVRANPTGIKTASNSNIPNSPDNVYVKGVRPNLIVTEDGGNVSYDRSSNNSTGRFRAQRSYIPSGTFFRAVLLGGLDAPTGGESQSANPHPVLMRIDSLAQLPNRFRQNFKECFVTGTGYGDLSSERAMIRTEQMSCVGNDGRAIDIPIKGWVAGEDGKTGVRGRLVTKQGAVLKNALISGVLSGIGQGFSTAANVTNTSALGAVSSVGPGKQLQNALGTGASGAFDRLAQYYIKLADKMFPVIEVDAGRQVDIVLLKGFQIGDE